jgi:hypothetical protein
VAEGPDERLTGIDLVAAPASPPGSSPWRGRSSGSWSAARVRGHGSFSPGHEIDDTATYEVTIATDKGDIVLELDPQLAPATVNNFVALARQGFYDNVTFHRVVPEFVIQGGDPEGSGRGAPATASPTSR